MASALAEPLADGRARRPRARVPLGPGLAAGDRPRAVRAAGGQARRHRGRDAGDPRPGRRGVRRRAAGRTAGRCSSTSRSTSCSWRPTPRRRAEVQAPRAEQADGAALERALALLADAERPVIMAGTNLYWGRGEDALRALAERRGIPVFLNGLGARLRARRPRARVRAGPQDRARARPTWRSSSACRWTSGSASARRSATRREIVAIDVAEPEREHPRARRRRALRRSARRRCARSSGDRAGHEGLGRASCARSRPPSARPSASSSQDPRAPLHPMRVYGELAQVLDRDAIVIGDGGDFVSFAGRVVDSYEPGCWLDPGPFGCLGCGPGYALAAKLAHPDRQVVLLLGDGAFGFSGMEFDTLARHGVERRRRDGQQRHLGAREAPDGVPLRRLVGRRRPAAGDALRRGRRGARRPRRARARAGRAAAARWSARSRAASRRS